MTQITDQIPWDKASEADLNKLIDLATERLEQLRAEKLEKVQDQYRELASSVGLTPEEVVMLMHRTRRKSSAADLAKDLKRTIGRGNRSATGKPIYKNPDNPQETWTGRGKKPGWLQSKIDAGQPLESFIAEKG